MTALERVHAAARPAAARAQGRDSGSRRKLFMSRMAEQYARPPLPLSPNMLQACQEYSWPGNLRELNNFIKRYGRWVDEKLGCSGTAAANDGHGATRDRDAHSS